MKLGRRRTNSVPGASPGATEPTGADSDSDSDSAVSIGPGARRPVEARASLAILLAVALLVAVIANAIFDDSAPRFTGSPSVRAPLAVRLPAADAISSAWYCTAGTATGPDAEELLVANIAREASTVTVTAYGGANSKPTKKRFVVGPRSSERIPVSSIANVPRPGIVVDALGGRVVVEHIVSAAGDFAVTPCATNLSRTWYFGAGTTTKGATDVISLFNPTADDVQVDVSTRNLQEGRHGASDPPALNPIEVLPYGRVDINLHELAPRNDVVATIIRARSGRIVAEQTVTRTVTGSPAGVGVALGSPGLFHSWNLAFGLATAAVSRQVLVLNPNPRPVELTVRTLLAGKARLAPYTVELQENAVSVVDLSRIPNGAQYALSLSTRGGRVVVESELGFALDKGPQGIALEPGTMTPSRVWAFAVARVAVDGRGSLFVANPGTEATRVQVQIVRAGRSTRLGGPVMVKAGGSSVIDLDAVPPDAALVVAASRPVVVERLTSFGSRVSLSPGVGR